MLAQLSTTAWTQAYDADGRPRDGAQVSELTGLLPARPGAAGRPGCGSSPAGNDPTRGAQLRLTDHDGWRITLSATNTTIGQLADLEVRHRLHARAEDRIRLVKDTGLCNLPLQDAAQNRVWLAVVMLAQNLLAWTALLGLDAHRAAEPERLRLRVLGVAARGTTTGRRTTLRLTPQWPWAGELLTVHQRLAQLPVPT